MTMTVSLSILRACVLLLCVAPALLLALLVLSSLLRWRLSEKTVRIATASAMSIAILASVAALITYSLTGFEPQRISYGSWFSFGSNRFAFDFIVDGFSLGFAMLSVSICGVTSAFSFRYLQQEEGFYRYFTLLALFVLGLVLVAMAGSVEVLYAGWEMLGISSALLVGFFQERRAPVENALRVFAVYRVSDAAMLSAAILLHHWAGDGSLGAMFASEGIARTLGSSHAFVIALLILIAVAGKSALLPFSGWLPRAMEGPTSSSAVYYGALSIHAGCYLLLRAESLLAHSPMARLLAVLAGATTALYASIVGRVQSDIKSSISYAALTQVGVIIVEIALGFTHLAFLHMVSHACFRLLQFLSSPNILHDLHQLENRLEGRLPSPHEGEARYRAFYLVALERGFLDRFLDRLVVAPLRGVLCLLDRLDRILSGSVDAKAERAPGQRGLR